MNRLSSQRFLLFALFVTSLLACNFANQFGSTPAIGPPPTIISEQGDGSSESGGSIPTEEGETAVSGTPSAAPTSTLPAPSLSLTTLVPVNTRFGPSTDYEVIEQLPEGHEAQVVGQNEDGTWWAIKNPNGINGRSWVFGEIVSVNGNSLGVPVLPDPPQLDEERVEYENENGRYQLEHSEDLLVLPSFGSAEQNFSTANTTNAAQLPPGALWLTIRVVDNPDEEPLSRWADQFPEPTEVRSLTIDGNPAIQQVEDERDEETNIGLYGVATYIAHEARVVIVRAQTMPVLPDDEPFVYYEAEYDAILASMKLRPEELEPLAFDVHIDWRLDPNDNGEAIATVTIVARGGDGDYVYFRDGSLRQEDAVFEYRWRSCTGNPVSFQVEDGTGARVSQERFEQTPCP